MGRKLLFALTWLGAGVAWMLTACGSAGPPAVHTQPPSRSAPSATPSPWPLASPPPPQATPTAPWAQGAAWPTPETPLLLTVEAPASPSPDLWRRAVALGAQAQEIWLGETPSLWRGPSLPPEARVLFATRRPSPDGARWDLYFTLRPEDLTALQRAVAQAGWAPLRNINPPLAQMAPGLVFLEFFPQGGSTKAPLDLFLVRLQGEPRLWARMTWPATAVAPAEGQPPLPWGLALPSGWQPERLRQESTAPDGRLEAAAFLLRMAGTSPAEALALWGQALQAQGWAHQAQGEAGPVRWSSWALGARQRTLVVVLPPWAPETALVLAYTLEGGAPPSEAPRWHGRLAASEGRQAALLALLFQNPQFGPSLTLTLGGLPPGEWPLASRAAWAWGWRSGDETLAWLQPAPSATAVLQALDAEGWTWRPPFLEEGAAVLLDGPWPENSGPGQRPVVSGGLCRGQEGYLARLWPGGMLALRPAPGLCPGASVGPSAEAMGLLPWPPGYPLTAYGALQTAYVGYNTGVTLSQRAFWLDATPQEGMAWMDQSAQAFREHEWSVERPSPTTLLAHPPVDQGGGDALLFALPAQEGRLLVGWVANR